MKRIILGTVDIDGPEGPKKTNLAGLYAGWLKMGDPRVGMNYEEMGNRLPVIRKMRKAETENQNYIDLETPQFEEMVKALHTMRFTHADEGLWEARDRIINAAESPPPPPPVEEPQAVARDDV